MEAKDRGKKELLNLCPPALRILNNSTDRFFKIFDVHATLMRRTSGKTIGTFKQCSAFSNTGQHWTEKYFHFVALCLDMRAWEVRDAAHKAD